MRELITKLWAGGVCAVEKCGVGDEQLSEAIKGLEYHLNNVSKLLGEKYSAEMHSLNDSIHIYCDVSKELAFCSGFSMAVKLFAEACSEEKWL